MARAYSDTAGQQFQTFEDQRYVEEEPAWEPAWETSPAQTWDGAPAQGWAGSATQTWDDAPAQTWADVEVHDSTATTQKRMNFKGTPSLAKTVNAHAIWSPDDLIGYLGSLSPKERP